LKAVAAPQVFDARAEATAAEEAYPPYPFIGMDGEVYHLPNPLMLRAGDQLAVIQAQAANDPEAAELALRALLAQETPEALEAMDAMPSVVVGKLMLAWRLAGQEGVESLGEELTERSAPNRAARRSKQISPSGA
jgi:hypothetical protein